MSNSEGKYVSMDCSAQYLVSSSLTGYMHRMCRRSCSEWDPRAAALTASIAPPADSSVAADFAAASSFRLGPALAQYPEVGLDLHRLEHCCMGLRLEGGM